jgi:hypothetical protein
VQRDRKLVSDSAAHGKQVSSIQRMPPAEPRNVDQSLAALLDTEC